MAGEFIEITNSDGETFSGYFSVPKSGSGPGVVVLQEIFGINPWLRDITDALADHGYTALAPDLFWRIEPGISLSYNDEDMAKAFDLFARFDPESAIGDIQGSLTTLRARPECTGAGGGGASGQAGSGGGVGGQDDAGGQAGTVGFCLGGLLAWLAATRTDTDCSISYYGVSIEQYLGEADNISSPVVLHIAEEDSFVPPAAQAELLEMSRQHSLVEAYTYPGCEHAFATPGRDSYNEEAASLAAKRSFEAFEKALGS